MTAPVVDRRRLGRTPSRLDPVAPDWLVRILSPTRAPVPWVDMLRVAVTLVSPLGVGVLAGQSALGVYAAMGALAGALADRGGARSDRVLRIVSGVGLGAVGLFVGRLSVGDGVVPVVVVALLAAVSALLSSVNATLSFGGLQLLVYVAVAGGLPATLPLPGVVAAFLAGGVFAFLLSLLQSVAQRTQDVYRAAVVAVVRSLARLLREPGGRSETGSGSVGNLVVTHRRAVTTTLDAAYDLLLRARAVSPGRRADLRRLTGTLTALSPLVSATVAYARTGRHAPGLADLVDGLADAIAAGDDAWRPPTVAVDDVPARTATRPLLHDAVVRGVERAAASLPADRTGDLPAPAAGTRERATPAQLLLGRTAWTFVARLGVTMGVAEVVRQLVPIERSYWILLTAALVLKPDLGSVFARGVQRTLGTLVGVLLGAGIVAAVPSGPWVLVPIAVFAALCPFGIKRNYGLFSTFLTPVVLLLIDFGRPIDASVALDRLADTGIGAGVVLVVGYLLWPSTWRPRLGERAATSLSVLAAYVRAAFGPDRSAAGAARRRTYRSLSDLRGALQATLSEPPPISAQAAAWWPLIVQVERAADALTHAMVVSREPDRAPVTADVDALAAAIDDLAVALRAHRPPRDLPLPEAAPLTEVSADVAGARRVATGPATRRGARPLTGSDRRATRRRSAPRGRH